jgi:hypothetical protein
MPITVDIEGFNPFTPPNASDSGIPMAALTYHFHNQSDYPLQIDVVASIQNFLGTIYTPGGYRPVSSMIFLPRVTSKKPFTAINRLSHRPPHPRATLYSSAGGGREQSKTAVWRWSVSMPNTSRIAPARRLYLGRFVARLLG